MSRVSHKSHIVFALCTVFILAVMLNTSPHAEHVQAQATQAASIQACAGIDTSATMPANMSMPGMTTPAATMDMGGMGGMAMGSAVVTVQATAATDMSGMGSMNSTQPADSMGGMVMTTPTTMAMQATSAADMGGMSGMDMGSTGTPAAPSLRILSPTEGQTIKGNEVHVQVDVSNLTIDAQNHLHIYLDGQIAAMAYTTDTQLENVPAGIHDLCVIVANAEHVDSSLRAGVSFVVAP